MREVRLALKDTTHANVKAFMVEEDYKISEAIEFILDDWFDQREAKRKRRERKGAD